MVAGERERDDRQPQAGGGERELAALQEHDLLEQVVAVCPVVEVNTGAISRGWRQRPYPADFLLRGLREMGGQVILGADTHAADTVDCAFPQAVELIRAAGFDHLLTLWDDGFREQPL